MHTLQNGGNMPDQKLDNLLNLALDATEEEREKSRNLNVGYEKQTRKWEIIVKYSEMGDYDRQSMENIQIDRNSEYK